MLRSGEIVVLVGAAGIAVFAVVVGVLIYLKPPPVQFVHVPALSSTRGEMVFRRENCLTCHELFGNGTTYGPSLDGIGSKRDQAWLREFLRSPRAGVSERPYRLRMPPYDRLPAVDMEALLTYLSALRRVDANGALVEPAQP